MSLSDVARSGTGTVQERINNVYLVMHNDKRYVNAKVMRLSVTDTLSLKREPESFFMPPKPVKT